MYIKNYISSLFWPTGLLSLPVYNNKDRILGNILKYIWEFKAFNFARCKQAITTQRGSSQVK